MLKELFPGSTDFTVAIFKIDQISKHFSAILLVVENWFDQFDCENCGTCISQ